MLCKFFDNLGPIPHHMHQNDEHAKLVSQRGKPEATISRPNTTSKAIISRIRSWVWSRARPRTISGVASSAGTKVTTASCTTQKPTAEPGTGWQINAGVLHAPGSLVTYEPQVNSDVFAMFQSMVEGRAVAWELLVKDVPKERSHDLDFLIGMLDWEANLDPEFASHNRVFPSRSGRSRDGGRRVTVKLGHLWNRSVFCEGTDRASRSYRHDPRSCCLRADPYPRLRNSSGYTKWKLPR